MDDTRGGSDRDLAGSTRYPLSYRITGWMRALGMCLSLFFVGCGIALLVTVAERWEGSAPPDPLLSAMGLAVTVVGLWLLVYCFHARLTISTDSFEYRGAFSTRRYPRSDILGRRYQRGSSGSYPVVVFTDGRSFTLQPNDLRLDDRFEDWFSRLPDLDAEERTAMLSAITKDVSLGTSPDQRVATLNGARSIAWALNVLAALCVLWVLAYPKPYELAVAAVTALPWMAVLMVWYRPRLFCFDGRSGDVRKKTFFLLLAPPVALMMRAVLDVSLVDLTGIFVFGPLVGLPLLVAAYMAPRPAGVFRTRDLVTWPVVLVLAAGYGISLLALVDKSWDRGHAEVYPTTVAYKYVARGKGLSYYVVVRPWSAAIDRHKVRVSGSFYASFRKGDPICVALHPGAMGLRWIQLVRCP